MGNRGIHRLRKQMKQPIALVDAKVMFNDCRVFLAHSDEAKAKEVAGLFQGFMAELTARAKSPNLRDMYAAHFKLLERVEAGKGLIVEPSDG